MPPHVKCQWPVLVSTESGKEGGKSRKEMNQRNKKRRHEESVITKTQESMELNDMRRFIYAIGNSEQHLTAPVPVMCDWRDRTNLEHP